MRGCTPVTVRAPFGAVWARVRPALWSALGRGVPLQKADKMYGPVEIVQLTYSKGTVAFTTRYKREMCMASCHLHEGKPSVTNDLVMSDRSSERPMAWSVRTEWN